MKIITAVKDTAVESFGTPVFVRTNAEAMRSFTDEANRTDGQSAIAQHPEDYELYVIGTYDEDIGLIQYKADDKGRYEPERLARAKDVIQPRN